MPAETEENYPLENGLLRYPEIPKPVEEFYRKHGYYPALVIVNPKHQVNGTKSEYFKSRAAPSIAPLVNNKDIEVTTAQGYYIAIEYDQGVEINTIICKGRSALQQYHG